VYDEAVSETAELTLVALVVKDGTVEDGGRDTWADKLEDTEL